MSEDEVLVQVVGDEDDESADVQALARALREAAALPRPNEAAREATAAHDLRRQAERVEAILSRAVRDRRA